jgi:CRISPR-associated protein (TIGR02584 family)
MIPSTQNMTETETILFALVGLSPAVLTETLWAWVHENPDDIPDRVVVVTTTEGRRILEQQLFQRGKWAEMLHALSSSTHLDLSNKLRP